MLTQRLCSLFPPATPPRVHCAPAWQDSGSLHMLSPLPRMPCPSGFLFVTWQVPRQPLRPTPMALPPESRPSPCPPRYQGLLCLLSHLCPRSGTVMFISSPISSSLAPGLARCQAQAGPSIQSEQETRDIGVPHTVTGSQLVSPHIPPHRESHPIDSIDRPSAPRKCLCKGSAGPAPTPAGSALPRGREKPLQ